MTYGGHCLCGAVRYSIDAEPLDMRLCWCRDCQYIASGSPTVNVLFPEESVHFEGDMGMIEMVADSGNTVQRGFCTKCGSQLFSATLKPKGLPMRIRAGTLDNPDLMSPSAIIWAESAPNWASLDPDLPQHVRGPDSPLRQGGS